MLAGGERKIGKDPKAVVPSPRREEKADHDDVYDHVHVNVDVDVVVHVLVVGC
jgi:hypothetical protein